MWSNNHFVCTGNCQNNYASFLLRLVELKITLTVSLLRVSSLPASFYFERFSYDVAVTWINSFLALYLFNKLSMIYLLVSTELTNIHDQHKKMMIIYQPLTVLLLSILWRTWPFVFVALVFLWPFDYVPPLHVASFVISPPKMIKKFATRNASYWICQTNCPFHTIHCAYVLLGGRCRICKKGKQKYVSFS